MVNSEVILTHDPERALVLSYAPASAREALAALLALDDRLGALVRAASEPMLAAMRLTWWFEALERLDVALPPAEPLLRTLAATVLPTGVTGVMLAAMVDGWERLLTPGPLDGEALASFGRERGGRLFTAAAMVLGSGDARVARIGEGWALADMSQHWSEPAVAARAAGLARERLTGGFAQRWPRALRPLGAMGLLARSDLDGGARGEPRRVARLLFHRLTGR